MLDVGCGSGMFARELAEHGMIVVGVDSRFDDFHGSSDSVTFLEGDYLALSEGLGEFDIVLALDVVEHFKDEDAVARALARNLRSNGRLIVSVPAYRWLWSSHDRINDHFRRYTRKSLTAALTRAGLEVQRTGYIFLGLLIPKALIALVEQFGVGELKTTTEPRGRANQVASRYFAFEMRFALRRTSFLPVGTSVVGVATRPSNSGQTP